VEQQTEVIYVSQSKSIKQSYFTLHIIQGGSVRRQTLVSGLLIARRRLPSQKIYISNTKVECLPQNITVV